MKIEEQVCTLEQAKRLKELGANNESLYYWYQVIVNGEPKMSVVPKSDWHNFRYEDNESIQRALNGDSNNEIYPAYTVSELGEMLPDYVDTKEGTTAAFRYGRISKQAVGKYDIKSGYTCSASYRNFVGVSKSGYGVYETWKNFDGETLAQCLGNVLIYLIENKLTKPINDQPTNH